MHCAASTCVCTRFYPKGFAVEPLAHLAAFARLPLATQCVHPPELKNKVTEHRSEPITDPSIEANGEILADTRSERVGTKASDRQGLLVFARRCYVLNRGMNTTPHTLACSKSVIPSAISGADMTSEGVEKSTLVSRAQMNSTVLSF